MAERSEQIAEERKRQARLQRKMEDERQAKRELVEDFKFRKEMEKAKDRQLDEMHKRKEKANNDE